MRKVQSWLVAGAVCGLAPFAQADSATEAELREKVEMLERRLAQVENKNASGALDQRRAEEVRALIQEVLADADTRASLMQDGLAAGHDGKAFFLASPDGKFRLNFGGQLQFRYLANFENDSSDNEDDGFQVRRTKFEFGGHVEAGPKWDYTLVFESARSTGNTSLEDFIVGTKITDNMGVRFGHFKLPFLREELNSSKRLLAVERAVVTEYFTFDRSEQVQLTYSSDLIKAVVAISDGVQAGSTGGFTDIGGDNVEVALTGRVDIRLAGDWKQMDDVSAWSGEAIGVFLGGAVHYQLGDANNSGANGATGATVYTSNYLAWTVDASFEASGFGIMAAFTGGHIDPDAAGTPDRDMYGFLIQAGFFVIPDKLEPFVRFEWIDDDDSATEDDVMIVTAGFNYYFKKHNAKLTIDVLYWFEGQNPTNNPFGASETSTGLGFSTGDSHEGDDEQNILLRAQFQLLF